MTAPAPLQVDEIGERCRYRVHSEAKPQNLYLVDLLTHEGRAECSCRDWICRCWPLIKRGERATCKHGRAAREHFLNGLLAEMAAREQEPAAMKPNTACSQPGKPATE